LQASGLRAPDGAYELFPRVREALGLINLHGGSIVGLDSLHNV
jgi:hypothetical protein